MPSYSFIPDGICPSKIDFEYNEGVITKLKFTNGCIGNLEALSRLIDGKQATEIIKMFEGIACQGNTSCPDQLAKKLKEIIFIK